MITLADAVQSIPSYVQKALAFEGKNSLFVELETGHEPLGQINTCCIFSVRYLDERGYLFKNFGNDLGKAVDFYNQCVQASTTHEDSVRH